MYYWHRNPQCSPLYRRPPLCPPLLGIGQVCARVYAKYMRIYASGYRVAFYKLCSPLSGVRPINFFRCFIRMCSRARLFNAELYALQDNRRASVPVQFDRFDRDEFAARSDGRWICTPPGSTYEKQNDSRWRKLYFWARIFSTEEIVHGRS